MEKIFTIAEKALTKKDYLEASKARDAAIQAIQAVRVLAKMSKRTALVLRTKDI